jgi:hypothetical protein
VSCPKIIKEKASKKDSIELWNKRAGIETKGIINNEKRILAMRIVPTHNM